MTHPTRDDALKALDYLRSGLHPVVYNTDKAKDAGKTLRAFIEGKAPILKDPAGTLNKGIHIKAIEGLDEAIDEAEFELFEGPTWVTLASGNAEALCKAARAYQQMHNDNNPAPLSTMGNLASLNQQAEPEGTPERGAFSGGGGGSGEVRERTCEKCGAYRIVQTGKDGNMSGKKCTCKAYR